MFGAPEEMDQGTGNAVLVLINSIDGWLNSANTGFTHGRFEPRFGEN